MSYCNLKYFLTVSKVKQTWSITCIYICICVYYNNPRLISPTARHYRLLCSFERTNVFDNISTGSVCLNLTVKAIYKYI